MSRDRLTWDWCWNYSEIICPHFDFYCIFHFISTFFFLFRSFSMFFIYSRELNKHGINIYPSVCLLTCWRWSSGNPSRNEEFCFSRASCAVVLTVGSLPERLSDSGEPPVLSKAPVGSTAPLLLRAQRWGRLCECEVKFTPTCCN